MADPANTTARLLSAAASDNATLVNAGQTYLRAIEGFNVKAAGAPVYLKLYDKATTPESTDTPRKTFYIPSGSTTPAAGCFLILCDDVFHNGLGYRITGAAADNDATNLVAGDVLCLNIDYR